MIEFSVGTLRHADLLRAIELFGNGGRAGGVAEVARRAEASAACRSSVRELAADLAELALEPRDRLPQRRWDAAADRLAGGPHGRAAR
jgi:hypothetical protein